MEHEVNLRHMTFGKARPDNTASLKTKLALTRISRWHSLGDESISMVREELMVSLGLGNPQIAGHNTFVEKQSKLETESIEAPDHTLNSQIRHLVGAGAPWHVIFPLLWQEYQKEPSLIKAARILETAFVEASQSDTLQIFSQLMTSGQKNFYWYLHPKLRDFIIEHAPQQYLDQLYWTIAKERDDAKLSGIELTYIFLRVATNSDKTAAWTYFRRHQNRILGSFSRAKHFGMSKEQLIFRAGELALGLGFSSDAKELFLALPNGSQEREAALQLILRIESKTIDCQRNSYFILVESADSWGDRLTLIQEFCDSTRKLGGNRDPNRPALDLLFKQIFQWIPKNPDAWRATGDLLVRNRDIASLLPSIFQPLLDQAVIFHGPDIDGALWNAASSIKPQNEREHMLYGIALLHKYVTNPRLGESVLWQAHATFKLLEASKASVTWSWRDLTIAARQWINDSTILVDRDRRRAAAALRLAAEGGFATAATVENYLNHCTSIPDSLLVEIAKNALSSKNADFALSMLVRTGLKRSFTNKQLLQMWNLAVSSESPDLAWRIATTLVAREALPEFVKSAWDISGENRSSYQPISLVDKDIEAALTELSTLGRKLIKALCIVGSRINELAIITESNSQSAPSLTGSTPTEKSILAALKTSAVMPKAIKAVPELTGVHMVPDVAAPFAQAIVTSPWLFAVRAIAERLSVASWGWNVEVLQQNARAVLPLIGRDSTGKSSAKISRWLSSLSSAERSAWNDLIACSQDANSDVLAGDIVKFICRLAIIHYPAHLNAIKTAHHLRASLDTIRDMEWFILSDALTLTRRRHVVAARVAVPDSIKKTPIF